MQSSDGGILGLVLSTASGQSCRKGQQEEYDTKHARGRGSDFQHGLRGNQQFGPSSELQRNHKPTLMVLNLLLASYAICLPSVTVLCGGQFSKDGYSNIQYKN
mmetsp:Transcript_8405/g.17438  ORF Transcript_8405/g.17438 Transcript_8405/m.17438 type:complete len:103 (-) Transcript_8405:40-348(-)